MEQSTLLKIARLRTLAARHGKAFDVVRFVGDRAFALKTLQGLMDTEEEALLVAGLELMQAMRMISADAPPRAAAAAAPAPAAPAPEKAAPPPEARYVGRLR